MTPEAPPALTENICWLLNRASHAMSSEIAAALEESGMSPRGHEVLSAAATGAYTQTELVNMVGLDKTTMVVALDELEQLGWAERRPSPTDRRARIVAVTPAGTKRLREADKVLDRVRDDVLGTLTDGDRDVLVATLQSLVTGRFAERPPGPSPVRRRRGR
jgi:MarR family transcriptional regulator, transcriptional regulator for hemolysin